MPALDETFLRLRALLADAKDLTEPWGLFHEELVASPAFSQLGQPHLGRQIESAIKLICSKVLTETVVDARFEWVRVPEQRFQHGRCEVEVGTAKGPSKTQYVMGFLFEDTNQGLLGIRRSPFEGPTILTRFSILHPARGDRSMN